MTITVGIREITRNTSKVVHQAASGETIVITEHDRPIAMLVPLPSTGNAAVDELIVAGRLNPASNPGGLAALLAIAPAEATSSEDTAEAVNRLRDDHA